MLFPKKTYLLLIYIFAKTAPQFWQKIQNKAVSVCLYYLWGSKQKVLHTNTAQVLGLPVDSPVVRKTVIQLFRNYGLYLRDYVLIHDLTQENYKETVAEEIGTEYIEKALADGNGAILITPHLGNWELGGVTFALRGCPIHVLTLKDQEDAVQDYRDEVRGSLGIKTLHVDPNDHGTILKMARLLKANNVIAMLGDRLVGGKKSEVVFFGRKVYFPSGAMALSQATGAPIIPVFITLREDGKYKAWMEKTIMVAREPGVANDELIARKTQELALVFEKNIRRHPDQWYQFFDYWSTYSSEDTSS
ncbi:MAG: lysophospholipid acyltransferase family protein [Desulfobulbaceae bacterium]|jgi:lauroyl/myristoyl acyltransferase|nr:lysophospholipid acyltransferase family protein [Desulfobulbaceae bacterium]